MLLKNRTNHTFSTYSQDSELHLQMTDRRLLSIPTSITKSHVTENRLHCNLSATQANLSDIQANLSDIQANLSDIQANQNTTVCI